MIVRLLGDIHGAINNLGEINNNTIQLGDFNLFGYQPCSWYIKKQLTNGEIWVPHFFNFKNNIYFIDGNHDNFPILKPDHNKIQKVANKVYYIPRGFVSGKVLFIGGADSIDQMYGIQGSDWHKEEQINSSQVNKILKLRPEEIDVILSHEAPLNYIISEMKVLYKTSQKALQTIFEYFHPKLWIHAHYHKHIDKVFEGCHFIGLDIDEYIDIDLPIEDDFFSKYIKSRKNKNVNF